MHERTNSKELNQFISKSNDSDWFTHVCFFLRFSAQTELVREKMSLTLALNYFFVREPHLWYARSRFYFCELQDDVVKLRFNELVRQAQSWKNAGFEYYQHHEVGLEIFVNNLIVDVEDLRIQARVYKEQTVKLRSQIAELERSCAEQHVRQKQSEAQAVAERQEIEIRFAHQHFQTLKVGLGGAVIGFGMGVAMASTPKAPAQEGQD